MIYCSEPVDEWYAWLCEEAGMATSRVAAN